MNDKLKLEYFFFIESPDIFFPQKKMIRIRKTADLERTKSLLQEGKTVAWVEQETQFLERNTDVCKIRGEVKRLAQAHKDRFSISFTPKPASSKAVMLAIDQLYVLDPDVFLEKK